MRFNILSWESRGLRCPDFNINIKNNNSIYPSFIQMPNGNRKDYNIRLDKICFIKS